MGEPEPTTERKWTLPMIVIYERPADYPTGFVVRQWNVSEGIVAPGKLIAFDVPTLTKAREYVPRGLYNLGRKDEDERCIVEVWV